MTKHNKVWNRGVIDILTPTQLKEAARDLVKSLKEIDEDERYLLLRAIEEPLVITTPTPPSIPLQPSDDHYRTWYTTTTEHSVRTA